MTEFEEAQLEKNLREFVLGRTAEPVYLELREGLIIIRHLSRYGSSILATLWSRVLQHPNNFPPLRYPYKKLYDTKGLWKVVLQVDDVVVTIFTKTGTLTIKGAFALEWFVNRFQSIMDGFQAPVQETQSVPRSPRRQTEDTNANSDTYRSLNGHSEEGFSSRMERLRNRTQEPLSVIENNDRTEGDLARPGGSGEDGAIGDTLVDNAVDPDNSSKRQLPADVPQELHNDPNTCSTLDCIDYTQVGQAKPQPSEAEVPVGNLRNPEFVSDLVVLGEEHQATGGSDPVGTTLEPVSDPEQTNEQTHDVTGLLDRAKEVIFDLIDEQEASAEVIPADSTLDIGEQYRRDLQELNATLKTQDLDLWIGDDLENELKDLSGGCVREGSSYVYKLWKSLLHKFMSQEDCKLYIASPNMDKLRLQDICHALLRNRLSACVDAVFVRRHCDSAQLISDVKRSAIREFPTRDQVFIEYKLYSSFVYPFQEFHYRFLAGVKEGQAEIMITSADFHGNHFENDSWSLSVTIK